MAKKSSLLRTGAPEPDEASFAAGETFSTVIRLAMGAVLTAGVREGAGTAGAEVTAGAVRVLEGCSL